MNNISIGTFHVNNGTRALSSSLNSSVQKKDDKNKNRNITFKQQYATADIVQPKPISLVTKQEQQMYNVVSASLKKNGKSQLNNLLKTGRLLDKKSNNKSSTLENLYKIATTERVRGLSQSKVLQETVATLDNPFLITQKFGDIPKKLQNEILNEENNRAKNSLENSTSLLNLYNQKKSEDMQPHLTSRDLNVKSNCCVAASIEFNIAHRTPAEFSRMVEQLTSPNIAVTKTIPTAAVSENTVDAMWLLNEFGTKYKFEGWDKVSVVLNPDRNAIIRARVQNTYKDKSERSLVDVLMQSMLMNVGSQQSYNSLTDLRTGKFNSDNEGLTNIEKNYVESLATGKNTILVTYQIIDENSNLLGYECELSEMKKHITDALNIGENVIIGYTYTEPDGKISKNGHEITILGTEKDKYGTEYFICKDTDNESSAPIKYKIDEFLPKIHHAGLPKSVLKNNVEFIDNWVEVMEQYKASRSSNGIQAV